MLTWFSEKAKWIIYVIIGLIAIALLSMDFMSLQWNTTPSVATWGKKEIPIDQFDANYKQAYDGQNDLSETDKAKIREEVLTSMVNARLLDEELVANKIAVSDSEMVLRIAAMIESDPRTWLPNPEILKQFQDESGKLDQAKFRKAMAEGMQQGSSLFRYFEAQIRQQASEQHLQQLVLAGFHPTDLEAKFLAQYASSKSKLAVVSALVDSFPASADENTYKAILAKATPESLLVRSDIATFEAVTVPNIPSATDIALAKENADTAYAHLMAGKNFGDVSFDLNEDSVARADSGRLGGYRSLDQWVPEFATAVQNLDSGKISTPFQSRFGWHVVLCEGKKVDSTGKISYKLRHILSKITIGSDTHREIQDKLNQVRDAVLNGQKLADAAKAAGLKTELIPWTETMRLGKYGYLGGLSNFANPITATSGLEKVWNWSGTTQKEREPVSPVLRGDKVFALVNLLDFRAKGDTSRGAFETRARAQAERIAKQKATKLFLDAQIAELANVKPADIAAKYKGKVFADTINMAVGMGDWAALVESPSMEFGKALSDSNTWSPAFFAGQGTIATIAKPFAIESNNAEEIQRSLMGQYWRIPTQGKDHPAFADWKRQVWNKNAVKTFLEQNYKGDDL